MLKPKSKNMFDITIDDIKSAIFNYNADIQDYISKKRSYPYGWINAGVIKEDNSHFILTINDEGRFSLDKREGKYTSDENDIFVTSDVIDYHAPVDSEYGEIKISRLYKDKRVVGNLTYLKKNEIVSQVTLDNGDKEVITKSYNGPILVQGKRFFMINGSVWDIKYLVKKNGEKTAIEKTPDCSHVYGWGYVIR